MQGRAYLSLCSSPKVDLTELHSLLQCGLLIHLNREMPTVREPRPWCLTCSQPRSLRYCINPAQQGHSYVDCPQGGPHPAPECLIRVGMWAKGPGTNCWCQDSSQLTLRPHQVTFQGQLFMSSKAESDKGLRPQPGFQIQLSAGLCGTSFNVSTREWRQD